jgi:hypothetical protein
MRVESMSMSEELSNINEIVISSPVSEPNEHVASRKAIVYKTPIDPAVIRVEGEKNKHKLFKRYLLKLENPAEIEYVSTKKYYEPFLTVSGKYSIDYYRTCAYRVAVDKDVTEVVLFNNTFLPKQLRNESHIKLEGEERLYKINHAFLFLNKNGQELRLSEFPPAASEENPEDLIKSLGMPELPEEMDLEAISKRIKLRPFDVKRIVSEQFEIDERSVIYRPIYRVTYKCSKLGKEATLEFDGITAKIIKQNENALTAAYKEVIFRVKQVLGA